jgi:2-polyprenyl-3-methyl-5-hydroxy-6-metoxy-1,4-benzoquinol methylase
MSVVAEEYLRVAPGQRVLDLGCGDGALSAHLPQAHYTGIDHNRSYIDSAQRRYAAPDRRFLEADLADLASTQSGQFDVVAAIGVLHHLSDDVACDVLREAAVLLASQGRIVTVDPVFHPDQRTTARLLMALDRGRFVRHPEHYSQLVRTAGLSGSQTVRFDLNPFPYTHLIMELQQGSVVTCADRGS